jgi:hypothetical protein
MKKNIWISIILVLVLVLGLAGCDSSTQSVNEENSLTLKSVTVETKPSNWYIRLVAEDPARAMKTGSTQLGELDTDDNVSKHTLESLSPFGGTYLDVVFVDPEGVVPGEYKTSFHKYQENSEDSWMFTVKTDDSNAMIELTWRGLYILDPYVDTENRTRYHEYRSMSNPLLKHMKLVDTANGKEIPAIVNGKAQVYAFTMEGVSERTFKWILQTEEVNITNIEDISMIAQDKVIQKDALADQNRMIENKIELFDLNKPPTSKGRE